MISGILILIFIDQNKDTFSSYGVRLKINDNQNYYDWYQENEKRLEELYEEEFCQDMQIPFGEWTLYIFKEEFLIIYY